MTTGSIDHRQYLERCLNADVDGDLESEQRRAAQAHVAGCAECREKFAAESAMKAEVQTLAAVRAPSDLRDRIIAALDEVDRASDVRVGRRHRSVTWSALGAIAACLIAVVVFRAAFPSDPAFDSAIASYEKSERNFTPNVPSKSADELAASFINQFGVPMAWDFSALGLSSAGGRIEQDPAGKTVGYSLYKGDRGALLCVVYRDDAFQFPAGGEQVKGIHIYQYKGYSIAATNRYAVFSIMVTRMPARELAQVFAQLPG